MNVTLETSFANQIQLLIALNAKMTLALALSVKIINDYKITCVRRVAMRAIVKLF